MNRLCAQIAKNRGDVVVSAIGRGGEVWCVCCDRAGMKDAFRRLGYWAMDEDLSFDWYDCSVLVANVREEMAKCS